MCFGGKPKVPKAPAPPSETGAALAARRESRDRQRAQTESGRSSTLQTGSGVSDKSVTKKTLLGT